MYSNEFKNNIIRVCADGLALSPSRLISKKGFQIVAKADEIATATVRMVLSDKSLESVNFLFGNWSITPDLYKKVDKAILDGKITVMVEPELKKTSKGALYFPKLTIDKDTEWYDLIVLPQAQLGGDMMAKMNFAGTIIHECTHAGLDLVKLSPMVHVQHEQISYIAAATAQWAKLVQMGGHPEKIVMKTALERSAWEIAESVYKKADISKLSLLKLGLIIATHDEYKKSAFNKVKNDGVGRAWKMKP